jgi:hypothetical protein
VYAHHIPHISSDLGLAADALVSDRAIYIAACLALLGAPTAAAAAVHALPAGAIWQQASAAAGAAWRKAFSSAAGTAQVALAGGSSSQGSASQASAGSAAGAARDEGSFSGFVQASYGYMPLVWAALLAHYLDPLLLEAGTVLPAAARMVGWSSGTASLPVLVAHPAVVDFLQVGPAACCCCCCYCCFDLLLGAMLLAVHIMYY